MLAAGGNPARHASASYHGDHSQPDNPRIRAQGRSQPGGAGAGGNPGAGSPG
ncbi:hypothetical protein P4113_20850 [Pseudomonas aeruginosa]|nr:hypothetical protein [Pseudomonas aeruginosa]